MKNDHVVIDGKNQEFHCNICKAVEAFHLPCEVKKFSLQAKTFVKKHRKCANKNCNTCMYLEWIDGEHELYDSGYCCMKRQDGMSSEDESAFLKKLESADYRKKWKPCFEAVSK